MRKPAALVMLLVGGCVGSPPPCGSVGELCRLAGTGMRAAGADGLPALETPLYWVSSVRKGPDGRVYVMDQNNFVLRVIESDGRMSIVAGTGEHGGAIDGAPARKSPFLDPIDFAFRADGRIVIVSWHDTRLVEIGTDGLVHVVAGTATMPQGTCRGTGDGGPALAAGFCELSAIAIDSDGKIYVADDLAYQIRVIDPSGTIDNYAGTGEQGYTGDGADARLATLDTPSALALDSEGNLFIADTGNHVIRRIDARTRKITTVAGNGQRGFSGDGGPCLDASMDAPAGVVVGPDGMIYVSDSYNNRIRRVDLAADRIDTIVGTGVIGIGGDNGPALSAQLFNPARLSLSDGQLFISDKYNSVARVVRLP